MPAADGDVGPERSRSGASPARPRSRPVHGRPPCVREAPRASLSDPAAVSAPAGRRSSTVNPFAIKKTIPSDNRTRSERAVWLSVRIVFFPGSSLKQLRCSPELQQHRHPHRLFLSKTVPMVHPHSRATQYRKKRHKRADFRQPGYVIFWDGNLHESWHAILSGEAFNALPMNTL